VKARGIKTSIKRAARTPGAAVLRAPQAGAIGHIVISDGEGGTVEVHSSKKGVIEFTLSERRWDMGILVPGIAYEENQSDVTVGPPPGTIHRLRFPRMTGEKVKEIQRSLKAAKYDPGEIHGTYGPETQAAVIAFQIMKGLVPDGEVGSVTAKALGVIL
jgi:hypothetical protein